MRIRFHFLQMALAVVVMGSATLCSAQPLVTEGLSVYYNFDSVDEDGIWKDGSGNGLNGLTTLGTEDALADGKADIRLDTTTKVRGAGSAWFDTDANVKEDYIAVCDAAHGYIDNCEKADTKGLIPVNGFTVAAWVQVADTGTDQSIWQSRADGGGFTHTQIQGNGNIRMTLRGDVNSASLVNINEPPGGNPVPRNEWIHYAGTYERTNPEAPGEWAFYYNGQQVGGGAANGTVAGTPDEILGNWGQGAFLGMVPDFARQLVGRMDEFYLFTRALSAKEIGTLYNVNTPSVPGDFNADGLLTSVDIDALSGQVRAGTNNAAYDLNADTKVDDADRQVWIVNLKKTYSGDANLDLQFDSSDFVEVFQKGKYETGAAAGWAEGDWSGDALFDSSDFVAAFQMGGYEKGPRAAVAAVPEPSSLVLTLLGAMTLLGRRRK